MAEMFVGNGSYQVSKLNQSRKKSNYRFAESKALDNVPTKKPESFNLIINYVASSNQTT